MIGWQRHRTIILSDRTRRIVDEKASSLPQFDAAWRALEWLLARRGDKLGIHRVVDPTIYRLYRQAGDAIANTPEIVVLFTVDEHEVVIEAVRVTDRPNSPY
jgi:hypothetical protein